MFKLSNFCWPSLLLVSALACKKNSNTGSTGGTGTPPPAAPIVSSISPTSGTASTTVTITGKNFSSSLANDSVFFNGVIAQVNQASATQLQAVVPRGAGTGAVTVRVGSQTASGPVFTYTSSVMVSTIAGNGTMGFVDGNAASAEFSSPKGIAVDAQGNIYVSDNANNSIRKISTAGMVSTIAGTGKNGYVDGSGSIAKFYSPEYLAVGPNGAVYVADLSNYRIRWINSSNVVATLAGNGIQGYVNGAYANAEFAIPRGIAIDANSTIYVGDETVIRKISSGVVSTFAGGASGYKDGKDTAARFDNIYGMTVDAQNNIYVADANNNVIRKITPGGLVSTFAGNGTQGLVNGPANVAEFASPSGIAADALGNLYVTDGNNVIRMITSSGVVSTLAGNGTTGNVDGDAGSAEFYYPSGIAVDAQGNIYVADTRNNRIRKITIH